MPSPDRAGSSTPRFVFEKMLTYANHVGLFSEEIGATGEQLGNFPQAFTHLSLINAALELNRRLDAADGSGSVDLASQIVARHQMVVGQCGATRAGAAHERQGRREADGARRRRWVRRRWLRHRARQARRAGAAARPQQLPPVPAPALPGRHGGAGHDRRQPPLARPSSRTNPPSTSSRWRCARSIPPPGRSRPRTARTFTADYLVLAAGAKANFFHTPGAREHAFPLYTVADAERLRTRIFEVFEEADADASLIDRGALNFVIVGAGPTGVETAQAPWPTWSTRSCPTDSTTCRSTAAASTSSTMDLSCCGRSRTRRTPTPRPSWSTSGSASGSTRASTRSPPTG